MTIYRSKEGQNNEDEKSVYNYCYESWSPHANAFITMSQSFYKFHSTEFKWNKLDNIVVGNIPADTYENAMRMKRLKFSILPPEIYSDEEATEYFAKMDLLVEFFNKYAQGGGDVVSITKDRQVIEKLDSETSESRKNSNADKLRSSTASSNTSFSAAPCIPLGSSAFLTAQTPLAMALYKKTDAYNCDTAKFIMRSAKQGTPNWLYCRYDKTAYTYKAFQMEFHWVVCDAWLIDDMITLLYRRCLKWGLRLCQVPQYYSTDDLNVHPFRALPFIPVPRTLRESIPGSFPTPLRMVERLVFSRRNGWLFDNEYKTDWAALSMSAPSYLDRDRDLLGYDVDSLDTSGSSAPSTPDGFHAANKPHAFSSLSQSLSRMVFRQDDPSAIAAAAATAAGSEKSTTATAGATGTAALGASRAVPGRKPASARRLDRQYIHSSGLALARVAGQGFLWMQNSGSKVSDVTAVIEERRELVTKNMTLLTQCCERVTLCYELCVDVVERAMEYAQMAQIMHEFLEECIDEAFVKGEETLQQRAHDAEVAAALAAEIAAAEAAAEAAAAAAEAEAAAAEEARREAEFAAALEEQAIRERQMEMESCSFSAPHSMAEFGEEDAQLDTSNPYNPSFYFNSAGGLSSPKMFDKQNSRENSVGYNAPLETVPEETPEDLRSDNDTESRGENQKQGEDEDECGSDFESEGGFASDSDFLSETGFEGESNGGNKGGGEGEGRSHGDSERESDDGGGIEGEGRGDFESMFDGGGDGGCEGRSEGEGEGGVYAMDGNAEPFMLISSSGDAVDEAEAATATAAELAATSASGAAVGASVGAAVGATVGATATAGTAVGTTVGVTVGVAVGVAVGAAVGANFVASEAESLGDAVAQLGTKAEFEMEMETERQMEMGIGQLSVSRSSLSLSSAASSEEMRDLEGAAADTVTNAFTADAVISDAVAADAFAADTNEAGEGLAEVEVAEPSQELARVSPVTEVATVIAGGTCS